MNVTSLATVVGAADLSQRPVGSVLFHREDGLNKVYPHLVFSTSLQDERRSEHATQSREGYSLQDGQRNEKDEKKHLASYKVPLWEGSEAALVEQQPPSYESPFFSDSHQSRVSQLHSGPYNISPLLLKETNVAVKPDRSLLHSSSMSLPWDKSAAALFAPLYSPPPPQKNRLVLSKSSPADLEELSEDEKERVRVKRERNRVAAAKCRNRRRELLERLEKEAEVLEREQEVLRDNVKKLQAQKRRYQTLLEGHEPGCALNVGQNGV